jgi:hypothetical protein
MNYEEEDGEKYINIRKKVLTIEEAKKGDYVEYKGQIYKFIGWDYGTYPVLEDEEGEQLTIYPYY